MKPTDYEPPPESACRVFQQPIDTGLEDSLGRPIIVFLHQWEYRGLVVWFCVKLSVEDPEVGEIVVEKVDCCHGVVHRHRYDKRGVQIGEPRELRRLFCHEGAWHEVDRLYSEQNDYYFKKCVDIVGRWAA